jgi:hypothetical protein
MLPHARLFSFTEFLSPCAASSSLCSLLCYISSLPLSPFTLGLFISLQLRHTLLTFFISLCAHLSSMRLCTCFTYSFTFLSLASYLSSIQLYQMCSYEGSRMYLRPLCSAPNVHRPFPLPCLCTVVPCLEIASLHSRLSLFVSARHQGLGRHGKNDTDGKADQVITSGIFSGLGITLYLFPLLPHSVGW